MTRPTLKRLQIAGTVLLLCLSSVIGFAESGNVVGQIEIAKDRSPQAHEMTQPMSAAIWLTPTGAGAQQINIPRTNHFRLVQKDKQFTPHLLVVPVGSSVEFPNLDPFYHNVFSLFNGKRFDLGLYEAGSTRTVRFDLEGVSYIFCNIHPEMGAVIISLTTPYFAMTNASGHWVVRTVPDGTYELNVWAEGVSSRQLQSLKRQVHIGPATRDLGALHLVEDTSLQKHKNKFGEDYFPTVAPY